MFSKKEEGLKATVKECSERVVRRQGGMMEEEKAKREEGYELELSEVKIMERVNEKVEGDKVVDVNNDIVSIEGDGEGGDANKVMEVTEGEERVGCSGPCAGGEDELEGEEVSMKEQYADLSVSEFIIRKLFMHI